MRILQKVILAISLSAFLPALPAPAQSRFATIANFTNGDPSGLRPGKGALYGSSIGRTPMGTNCGMVFELQPPPSPGGTWTQTVLYAFADANDLCSPSFDPVFGPDGVLYGWANGAGGTASSFAGLYQLKPPTMAGVPWQESVLYTYGGANSIGVDSELIPGPGGSLYALSGAGANYTGELVQFRPPASGGGPWTATGICSLPGPETTQGPPNSLTAGPNGVFYVTVAYRTSALGMYGQILQLTPPSAPGTSWTITPIYNFSNILDGGNPNSLVVASDGTLYGTTYGFNLLGAQGLGTIFSLAPPASPGGSWTHTTLYNFGNAHPNTPLIMRNGKLYGALDGNDAAALGGAVFELKPPSTPGATWNVTYLHYFTNGQFPASILFMGPGGTLYGATQGSSPTTGQTTGTVYAVATP